MILTEEEHQILDWFSWSHDRAYVGVTTQFAWKENANYLYIPESVIGINRVFKFDGSNILPTICLV